MKEKTIKVNQSMVCRYCRDQGGPGDALCERRLCDDAQGRYLADRGIEISEGQSSLTTFGSLRLGDSVHHVRDAKIPKLDAYQVSRLSARSGGEIELELIGINPSRTLVVNPESSTSGLFYCSRSRAEAAFETICVQRIRQITAAMAAVTTEGIKNDKD